MISRFINNFKKDDRDEQRSFQRKVHGIVSRIYPDRIFTLNEDPTTIESDEIVYGLTNLHARFLLSSQLESDLEELVIETFQNFSAIKEADKDISWEEARTHLMPQLMPESFVRMAPIELMHEHVVDGVSLGFVIDGDGSYHYVHLEMRESWGVDRETMRSVAFKNLDHRSQGIEMMAFPGENAFFVINATDGFDAVRLLSPEMREVIAEHIGWPFFAGIPNRDFLICWSATGDDEFQNKMRQQISSDFDEQAYPLSPQALEVTEAGEMRFTSTPVLDARGAFAERN